MIRIVYRTKRPTVDSEFFVRPSNIEQLLVAEKNAGRLIRYETTFSNDELTRIYVAIWRDQASLDSFNRLDEVKEFVKKKHAYESGAGHKLNIVRAIIDDE